MAEGGNGRTEMRWASVLSERLDALGAAAELGARIRDALGGAPDVAFLFCAEPYVREAAALSDRLRGELGGGVLVGCSARSVIGGGRELELAPAVSVTAARLPGVAVRPLRLGGDGFPRGSGAWAQAFELAPEPAPHFVLLADPFSCDAEGLVEQVGRDFPDSVQIGGLASGAEQPGENALFLEHRVHRDGVVGVALQGDVVIDSVVAQGCRPIGQPLFVTRCRQNRLVELDGRPALEVLRALYERSEARDRELVQRSLFVGLEMRPELSAYGRGDYLVRNLVGADADTGALVVAGALHEGQVVQFHVRDARTSADDLEERLTRYCAGAADPPRGALLFSCLGRGAYLYGEPDHDSDALRRHLGPVPLGGFFCNGEIGPVERRAFLHGYTSAFALFRPRSG